MTVYVDNARIPARVGRLTARWSHLTADTPAELVEFAIRIGLREGWFQAACSMPRCDPCPHWHFDVTEAMRRRAIAAGAKPIDVRAMGELIRRRRNPPNRDHKGR
jgi:uncharacterized protein DUF4031